MLPTETKEQLRDALLACGFSQVGFTDTFPSRHQSYWRAWTNAGYAGEMLWLSTRRELRTGHLGVPELLDGAQKHHHFIHHGFFGLRVPTSIAHLIAIAFGIHLAKSQFSGSAWL